VLLSTEPSSSLTSGDGGALTTAFVAVDACLTLEADVELESADVPEFEPELADVPEIAFFDADVPEFLFDFADVPVFLADGFAETSPRPVEPSPFAVDHFRFPPRPWRASLSYSVCGHGYV